jgi:hypothetical protein
MREVDLAAKVVAWLDDLGWDVYQEVQLYAQGRVCDIVATYGHLIWAIECKVRTSIEVMYQAAYWPADKRSIAVPNIASNKITWEWEKVAEYHYKVGVIRVGMGEENVGVREAVPAPFIRQPKRERDNYHKALTPLHKTYAQAGTSGQHLTAYKVTMIRVREFIEKYQPCTVPQIVAKLGKMHYASESSAKGNLVKCLTLLEDWAEVDTSDRPFVFRIKEEAASE